MQRQLTFDLSTRPALERDDFFVSPANTLALATVDDWRNWPNGKLALVAPPGAGKSHLAHVWAKDTGARLLPAAALEACDVQALAAQRAVVVEDMGAPMSGLAQEALFHLHNLLLAEGGRMLLTATSAPSRWPLSLPDLASRMQGTSVVRIEPPDDALLAAMLLKHFADRQITPQPKLIDYLLKRIERSHAAVQWIVAALDAEALATQKKIGPKMAARLLDNRAE